MREQGPEANRSIQEARKRVEGFYTDYGEPDKEQVGVDEELKEGVAIFLAMGMETDASCWGHPERRDQKDALSAEQNLFPYIDFSGYEPTDGLDENGEPVGYSKEQVDAACKRMKKDAEKLKLLLEEFYTEHPDLEQEIELDYFDGMPGASLKTRNARQLKHASRKAQDAAVSSARKTWKVFLEFIEKSFTRTP